MFKSFCYRTLAELSTYKHIDKEEIFLTNVNNRLEKSLSSYEKDLDQCISYLKRRNELNVMRKLNRLK